MKNNISEENEGTNWSRKRQNEKRPGSQGSGGGEDGKQKRKIAMQKMESGKQQTNEGEAY